MTNKFQIFNKSSERMPEVSDTSIDLAVTDPPFNIGCCFGGIVDDAPHTAYTQKIQRVISEISRTLTPQGTAIFIVPAAVRREGRLYEYPEVYSELCQNVGLQKLDTFRIRAAEEDDHCVTERDIRANTAGEKSHSEEIFGLVFGKEKRSVRKFPEGRAYKYISRDGHPCPFPQDFLEDMLQTFYHKGDRVLDPFMGTGRLGVEVISRGGTFTGYEIAPTYFETARRNISAAGA
ncbi:site-specific DNA-methyltransferase [Candidatus Pacearchaeota archaeon]|nr:site-specific DNA-methyltransferase [Candidatus Pacearchaeota archaeon]